MPQVRNEPFGLRRLDHEDHEILHVELGRAGCGLKAGEQLFSLGRHEAEPGLAAGIHMPLIAVYQRHFRPAFFQVTGKNTPGSAGADHGDFHGQNTSQKK